MSLWQSFDAALSGGGFAALPLALAGGVVMGLNPCCLAFYPAVAATCCAVDRGALAVRSACAFVAGTAAATTLLGILAALAGHAVVGLGAWPRYAIAFVPLLMGTHLLGWARLPLPRPRAGLRGRGLTAAFLAGLLLSVVIGSCGTPVLASILSYAAHKGTLFFGAALLFVYGLGNGLPLLLAGAGAGALAHRAARSEWQRWAQRAAGVVLVGLGFYLILAAP
jgi:cytochrome c biogenesis protein CcdA